MCPAQEGRQPYLPPSWDNTACHLNERTCTHKLQFEDSEISWTVDWKHFIYEDYDEWLFLHNLPVLKSGGGKVPDVLVLSTGVHSCYHYEDLNWLPKHFRNVDSFLHVLLNAPVKPKAVILLDSVVHNDPRTVQFEKPTESQCAIEVNRYIQTKVREILKDKGDSYPWLSFISRDNITRGAPKELWEDARRVHLHQRLQKILLSYIFHESKKVIGLN